MMKYVILFIILAFLASCKDNDNKINCDDRPSLGTYEPCPVENG